MAWTNLSNFAAGAALTAARLNELVGNFKTIGDSWTTYTPAWNSSGTTPVLNNGTIAGAYMNAGKLLAFRILLTAGSTTTFGTGTYQFSLPAGMTPVNMRWGIDGFAYDDSSGGLFPVRGFWSSTSNVIIMRTWPTTAGTALTAVTPTVPFTFANLDQISLSGVVELA